MTIVLALVLIALLIVLNGLFVAAEFGIVGTPRASIERLASTGDRAAIRVRTILQNPRLQDRYIATSQLGITLCSLGLGMYGEHVLASWLAEWLEGLGAGQWIAAHLLASVIAVTALTYLHIVIGEMVPKTIALQSAQATALGLSRTMQLLQLVLYPFIVIFNGIGNGLLRLVGIDRREVGHHHYFTPEELQSIVEESEEQGMLEAESGQFLQELLEFDDLLAGEIMVPRVHIVGLPLDAPPDLIRLTLHQTPHTRYPVYGDDFDDILGSIHIKDLLRLVLRRQSLQRSDVRQIPFVPHTTNLSTLLTTMRSARTQMAVVMDEHGGTAGLVTIEDLFEEVIGHIEEGSPLLAPLLSEAEDEARVPGTLRLDELAQRLDRPLDHEEVDSVSGLILSLLQRPAEVGDVVVYEGLRFEVLEVEGRGVDICRVTIAAEGDDSSG
jgi:CBS domain containing-hemolysin-like protein